MTIRTNSQYASAEDFIRNVVKIGPAVSSEMSFKDLIHKYCPKVGAGNMLIVTEGFRYLRHIL